MRGRTGVVVVAVSIDTARQARIRRMCQASERRQMRLPSHLAAIEKTRIAQVLMRERVRAVRIKRRNRENERRKLMFGS